MKKYSPKINYQNQVAKSCIHCHQIHDAERQMLRDARQAISEDVLYLYPMPQVVGIELDPKERATILKVARGSAAEEAKLRAGDQILFAAGQPLVSIADLQWVLHNQPSSGGAVSLKVRRAGKVGNLTLKLADGWRRKTDFSWRVSTWDLRRMALGGARLKVDATGRKTALGLEVSSVGKYGSHAVAHRAGVRQGDKLKEISGLTKSANEAEAIAHILNTTKPGDTIKFVVARGGKDVTISFKAQ